MRYIDNVLMVQNKLNHTMINFESYHPVIKQALITDYDMDVMISMTKSHVDLALELGIPRDRILIQGEMANCKIKNLFGDYGPGYPDSIENWYKTQYGHGDESFIYNQTIFWRMKNFKGWVMYSPYDCYQLLHNQLYDNKKLFSTMGNTRFSDHNRIDPRIRVLHEKGYDPTKPTILLNHTWNKLRYEDSGYLNTKNSKAIEYLRKISKDYNIINKYHHQLNDDYLPDEFINVKAGSIFSRVLCDLADTIICDYGGSAVDALYYDVPVIYLDGYEFITTNKTKNTDILIHRNLLSATDDDFEYIFENRYEFRDIVEDNSDISRFAELLYPDLVHDEYYTDPELCFLEIMKYLTDGNSPDNHEYTIDTEFRFDINFLERTGLIGPPLKKPKNRMDRYLSEVDESLQDKNHVEAFEKKRSASKANRGE